MKHWDLGIIIFAASCGMLLGMVLGMGFIRGDVTEGKVLIRGAVYECEIKVSGY